MGHRLAVPAIVAGEAAQAVTSQGRFLFQHQLVLPVFLQLLAWVHLVRIGSGTVRPQLVLPLPSLKRYGRVRDALLDSLQVSSEDPRCSI